ncbi:hypothetical protein CQ12_28425 [Bradyrhizobium jicamae]|uniref:Uncharacterized protein n=1 Tax=Bradyrhizobium jicamae TaxID=280332 RepID=A0A0R3L9S1_9BRAD|nr:hypothetical protein [Bradyrhizobium jicamae]KRR04658.1 hypothetical protein CQ12_28425 [Bradyrhizobium jicamae]
MVGDNLSKLVFSSRISGARFKSFVSLICRPILSTIASSLISLNVSSLMAGAAARTAIMGASLGGGLATRSRVLVSTRFQKPSVLVANFSFCWAELFQSLANTVTCFPFGIIL